MQTLPSVLRAPRGEAKPRRDPLAVFREFLDHLDRVSRRKAGPRAAKPAKGRARRRR